MPRTITIELTPSEAEALWRMVSEGHSAHVAFGNNPTKAFVRAADAALEKVRAAVSTSTAK